MPADSIFMRMLKKAVAIIESDEALASYFGWEPITGDEEWDWGRRRRIHLDDDGTCSLEHSPKLVMCEVHQDNDFSLLGDGGSVDSDIEAMIGVIVYCNVPEDGSGEGEQILCGNLHSAVRQAIRKHCIEPTEQLWSDISQYGPACSFDQSKGWRRAGGIITAKAQRRIT